MVEEQESGLTRTPLLCGKIRWWKTSSGVRIVLSETIAYLYSKLVFDPERVRAEIATE